jgi:hypothetical protein
MGIMQGDIPLTNIDISPKDSFANRLKPIKEAKNMLKADLQALKTPGALGLTQSQINQQVRDAQQTAGAQANAQASEYARAALAGQGFQQGALTQAARETSKAVGEAGAKATSAAHEMSRQIQEREAARIRGELDAQRERARENTDKWLKFGIDAAPMVANIVLGVITGGASGGGVAGALTGGLTNMASGAAAGAGAQAAGAAPTGGM